MKLAFVGNSANTMLNFRLPLMQALVDKGYDITVVTPRDCDVRFLRPLKIHFIDISVDSKGTNICRDLALLIQLRRIYEQQQFDCIFHYTIKPNIYGSIAARRVGIPQVSVVTGLGYSFERRDWLFRLSSRLYRFALRSAMQVWFLNHEDCDFFTSYRLVDVTCAHVIPGEGVDLTRFLPRVAMPEHFCFLYCGRMLRSKGVEVFVEAARRLQPVFPHVVWNLLGPIDVTMRDAISQQEIESWVRHGYIRYLGVTRDVVPFLQDASCVVYPSWYREGVPRSLMEASAMQIPIITTDNVGCRDVVVDGQNGLLCAPGDVDELIDAMRRMLQMSVDEQQQMGICGRQMMLDKFDLNHIVAIYLNFLTSSILHRA